MIEGDRDPLREVLDPVTVQELGTGLHADRGSLEFEFGREANSTGPSFDRREVEARSVV